MAELWNQVKDVNLIQAQQDDSSPYHFPIETRVKVETAKVETAKVETKPIAVWSDILRVSEKKLAEVIANLETLKPRTALTDEEYNQIKEFLKVEGSKEFRRYLDSVVA